MKKFKLNQLIFLDLLKIVKLKIFSFNFIHRVTSHASIVWPTFYKNNHHENFAKKDSVSFVVCVDLFVVLFNLSFNEFSVNITLKAISLINVVGS